MPPTVPYLVHTNSCNLTIFKTSTFKFNNNTSTQCCEYGWYWHQPKL